MEEASKIEKLKRVAKKKMKGSNDPIHDIDHVKNVVEYVKLLSTDLKLDNKQKQALILAAWWHDVSRVMVKKTSLVWMPLFDDTISAFSLWVHTIKYRLFGDVVGLSTRLIICKSLGTGALFTKLLLKKKDRILVDILKDADALDVLRAERIEKLFDLVENSKMYYFGCKAAIWWWLQRNKLSMKTQAAKKYLEEIIRQFIQWATSPRVQSWFIENFGKKWSNKTLNQALNLLDTITLQNLHNTSIRIGVK